MKPQKDIRPFSNHSDEPTPRRTLGLKQALNNCRDKLRDTGSPSAPRDSWSTLRCFLHGLCVIVLTVFLLDLMAAGFLTFPLSSAHQRDLLVIGVCALLLAVLHLTAPSQKSF